MAACRRAIETCEGLKELCARYEAMSPAETSAWRAHHSLLFGRLDSFIERCQDVHYVTHNAALLDVFATVSFP